MSDQNGISVALQASKLSYLLDLSLSLGLKVEMEKAEARSPQRWLHL